MNTTEIREARNERSYLIFIQYCKNISVTVDHKCWCRLTSIIVNFSTMLVYAVHFTLPLAINQFIIKLEDENLEEMQQALLDKSGMGNGEVCQVGDKA